MEKKNRVTKVDVLKIYVRVIARRSIQKNLYKILGLEDFV